MRTIDQPGRKRFTRSWARRSALVVSATLLLGLVPGVEAAPSYSIKISEETSNVDDSCLLTAKASWRGIKIDTVVLNWSGFPGGSAATGTAPGSGPYDGAIRGRTAIFELAAALNSPPPTTWTVTAQYFEGGQLRGDAQATFQTLCF